MKQVDAKIISIEKVLGELERPHARTISGSYLLWLECPEITAEAKPGQYVMVRCGPDSVLPRPFSIHQVKNDSLGLFFGVWENGKGTNWLSRCDIGDSVEMFGPLGNGFSISPNSKNILLVAGGNGIAPFVFLAQEAMKKGKAVRLVYGTVNNTRYPVPSRIETVSVTEDGSVGYKGFATDLIPKHVVWADQIFACGPLPMYKTMAKMPALINKPVQVSLEVRMGCGRGVCYGCTIKTKSGLKKVCQDGPVFEMTDVMWETL